MPASPSPEAYIWADAEDPSIDEDVDYKPME
jgi:hypothetical protein